LRRLAVNEEGLGLVELLIAMVIMAVGIAALVAGFSSGILSVNRARVTSTAGALADKQMELYRQMPFASLPVGPQTPPTSAGYSMQVNGDSTCAVGAYSVGPPPNCSGWVQVNGVWTCAVGTYLAGPPPTCSGALLSRPVKRVTITVSDSVTAKVLITESATFDSSTG
jgi:type II secretory pathway pseudopilin PulG